MTALACLVTAAALIQSEIFQIWKLYLERHESSLERNSKWLFLYLTFEKACYSIFPPKLDIQPKG